jgi:hypothetical protein
MGTEALWVPAVIAAVGAGVQAKESHDTLKEQDEAAAQGIRTQAGRQREADARVAQEVDKLGQSTPEDSQREATNAFMEQLRRTRAQAHTGESVGAVSDAYNADSADASAAVDKYGANRAGVLGRINAPGLQRTAETVSRLRAGSELGQIARNASGDDFINQLRMSQIRANPWVMAGGQVMQSYGQSAAASSGAGAASKVPKGGTSYGGTFTGSTRGFA